MPRDRNSDRPIIDGRYYGTWRLPTSNPLGLGESDLLAGLRTVEHTFSRGERLDNLAFRYFNEPDYWWVIALVNGIAYPFASGGLVPGRVLRIPVDVKDVLDRVLRS